MSRQTVSSRASTDGEGPLMRRYCHARDRLQCGNPEATIPITRSDICVARTPIERSHSALRLLRDDKLRAHCADESALRLNGPSDSVTHHE